jgi:hypothetical protein
LVAALLKIKEATHDNLAHRPVQATRAPASLTVRDINITAGGHVAVAGRDVHQHVEGFDVAALLVMLAQVRQTIEASSIGTGQRERLIDDIVAIEAVAREAQPDVSRVGRMVKRLGGVLKQVGIGVGVTVLEAYAKQELGLS